MRQRLRALIATPRFTIVAFVTIAVLVCGITTIFSVVNGVVLRALPYPDYRRLAVVEVVDLQGRPTAPPWPIVDALAKQAKSIDRWAGYRVPMVMTIPDLAGELHQINDVLVTPDVFRTLDVKMARGRALNTIEPEPAIVINQALWQSVFGGRDDVLGRTVQFDKRAFTIVGVMQPGQDLPLSWLTMPASWRLVEQGGDPWARLTSVVHYAEGRTITEVTAELTVAAASVKNDDGTHVQLRVQPLLDAIVGDSAQLVFLFFGVAVLVVLIGIGNLTSLQLARNGQRRHEVLVRLALGASRLRVVRELVLETMPVGMAGGVAGLMIAAPAIRIVVRNLPPRFPRLDQIRLDADVALFALTVAVIATFVIGLIGAWAVTSHVASERLDDTTLKCAGRARLQRTLVGAQTAVALVLLIGTGLLLGSFGRLLTRDAGMREQGLWTASASLPLNVTSAPAQAEFWTSALATVQQLPGVEAAALITNITGPLSGNDNREGGIVAEGSTADPRLTPPISIRHVSRDYFVTTQTAIKRGRAFVPSDTAATERVCVINERTAALFWPGQDPIDKRLKSRNEYRTVVGVIDDYRLVRLGDDPSPQIYVLHDQVRRSVSSATVIFRASDRQTAAAVQTTLGTLSGDGRVRIASMFDTRWRALALERFRAAVVLAFACTALVLSLVGVGGLVGYTVAQRSREVAIRLALGAARLDIARVVTTQTLVPAAVGLIAGVFGAMAATRVIAAYLVDTAPIDPPTYAAALGGMAAAILLASLVPARRAVHMDPALLLRRD